VITGVSWADTLPPAEQTAVRELDPKPHRTQVGKRVMLFDGVVHFQAYAHLVSVNPAQNRHRFYTFTWHRPSSGEGPLCDVGEGSGPRGAGEPSFSGLGKRPRRRWRGS